MKWVKLPITRGTTIWVTSEVLLAAVVGSFTDEDTPCLAIPGSDLNKTLDTNQRFKVQLVGAEIRLSPTQGQPWSSEDATLTEPRDASRERLLIDHCRHQHAPSAPGTYDPYLGQFLPDSLIRALQVLA